MSEATKLAQDISGLAGKLKGEVGTGSEAGKAYPVHCTSCGWEGYRTHGPLKPCPKCGADRVVWTFTGRTKPGLSSGNPKVNDKPTLAKESEPAKIHDMTREDIERLYNEGKITEKEKSDYLVMLKYEEEIALAKSGGNPNSCRPCGRDTIYAVGRIDAMWEAANLAEEQKDPILSEALNLGDWAEKIDRILVSTYKTCNLKDFPAIRFRIGELKKEVIKSDWAAVKSRLLDIRARLSMDFETPA